MRHDRKFFERLTSEGKRLVPINYRFVEPVAEESISLQRLAESHFYRAAGYCCWSFHKPISKCALRRTSPSGQDTREQLAGEGAPPQAEEPVSDRSTNATLPPGQVGVFVLFACCVPVRGARRGIICDLQRSSFSFIPNGLYEILTKHRGKTVEAIKTLYHHKYDQEIDEYFEFLITRELGFWCNDQDHFPDLDFTWERAERITNAIIDVDATSQHDYAKLLGELDDLGCKALELRFFSPPSLCELEAVLKATAHGCLRSIDVLAAHGKELTPEALERLIAPYQRVNSLVIHSSSKVISRTIGKNVGLRYIREVIDSPTCCGQVHQQYFVTNLETFTEAHGFNTCLNRKISIDARGEIRNCPSLPLSFGNIRDISLHSAVAHRDFSALWRINKDQIDVCRDCEFRYICTDCRAYLSSPADLYSKPSKCTYDPYTAEWLPST